MIKKHKIFTRIFILAFICYGWGFYGHKQINRIACFSLPPELFGFYKANIQIITENAVNADKRRYAIKEEACRHYLDADHYEQCVPLDTIPHLWKDAVLKYTEDTLNTYGIVPWYIQIMRFKLTNAFKEKDIKKILKYSADIGHYIADLHVPLHSTQNYNGQYTNQEGIHGLLESRLPEIFDQNYNYFVGKAEYIDNWNLKIWNHFEQSFAAKDSVFKMEIMATELIGLMNKYSFETKGQQNVKVYSKSFCEVYHKLLNNLVERRLQKAIHFVASAWFTCWVDAGQPVLSKEPLSKMDQIDLDEIKMLDSMYRNGKINGRIEAD